MNLSLYIARRYLLSKKSRNAINIISGISVAGVAVGTAALIVILSVFNGFDGLIKTLFTSFDPDLKITSVQSKTFVADDKLLSVLRTDKAIAAWSFSLEENALLEYDGQQMIATMKGVDENYLKVTGLDSMLVSGEYYLKYNDIPTAVAGRGVSYKLNLDLDFLVPVKVHIPSRKAEIRGNFQDAVNLINTRNIYTSGVFAVQQEYDNKYYIVPLSFAREVLEYDNDISAIEIKLKDPKQTAVVKERLTSQLGNTFAIADRNDQHRFLYQVMQSEKWVIFLILLFILIIASFNVIASLTMLIIDKKKDINTLRSLGANDSLIRNIFFAEGMLISLVGAITGLLLGGLICWVQQEFGIIKLGSEGSFIISAYPVLINPYDFALVFGTVLFIGFLAAWYPVRYITRRFAISDY
ncbi:MAG: ABC transporter permease [Bacteroidales bacterium]|nr:ABC transporter permease [Bacteroidales bacterium]